MKFQVRTMDGSQDVVDLNAFKCLYMKWDLCGILCLHVVAAIH